MNTNHTPTSQTGEHEHQSHANKSRVNRRVQTGGHVHPHAHASHQHDRSGSLSLAIVPSLLASHMPDLSSGYDVQWGGSCVMSVTVISTRPITACHAKDCHRPLHVLMSACVRFEYTYRLVSNRTLARGS